LLELIACGFSIASTKDRVADKTRMYFPEQAIRAFAESVLLRLSATLVDNAALQEKLVLSLIHTKNSCTRGNIFAGLIYLSSKSAAISKYGLILFMKFVIIFITETYL
jgi:hypothetical protein